MKRLLLLFIPLMFFFSCEKDNPSANVAISTIDAMLGECGDLCVLAPVTALFEYAMIDANTVKSSISINPNIEIAINSYGKRIIINKYRHWYNIWLLIMCLGRDGYGLEVMG